MKLTQIAPNQTEIQVGNNRVFFSYQTPVAAIIDGQAYRTEDYYSKTTSKHINQWLGERGGAKEEQAFFDNLLEVRLNKPATA